MKNNAPKSGFFSNRILLAWTLCSAGALLCVVSLPAPGGQGRGALASSKATLTQIGATSTSLPCPGPAICGQTCSLDPFGTPIYCSNGQCQCAPGYDLQNGVCQPLQPEVIGTENVKHFGGYDCPGVCPQAQTTTWATVGSIYKAFDLVPVHGTAPGGEAFMPVWGNQATQCGDHGVGARCSGGSNDGSICNTSADCPGGTCTFVGNCQGGSNAGGVCYSGSDCAGTCGPPTELQCQEGTRDGLVCDACCATGTCTGTQSCCPGGTCVAMGHCSGQGALCQNDNECSGSCTPVPGRCSVDGRTCGSDADCPGGTCIAGRTWAGCAPDPFPFCFGLQESDEGDFDFDSCDNSEGCGSCGDVDIAKWAPSRSGNPGDLCGKCVSDFTDAWPYIDNSVTCSLGTTSNPIHHIGGVSDPARIDFPNNVIVYRAPTRWEDFSDFWDNPIDDDWTWDMESPGSELYDTDTEFEYHHGCSTASHGRIHIEFSSAQVTDNFTDDDWGPANQFWRVLRCEADSNFCNIGPSDRTSATRCFVKSLVNPTLTCPASEDVDNDCSLHDPMAVVVGVPSLDCADDAYQGTDEIHPVLAMAIRIKEPTLQDLQNPQNLQNPQPEKWAFFYRQHGDTGPCGGANYSRCLSNFKLPIGLPVVPANAVLTGADVHVEWHKWADETFGSGSADISVCGSTSDSSGAGSIDCANSFDLINGTVLNIHLPHNEDGVVGLVTVTPHYDTTPPTITCPANITKPADPGKCTAAVTFAPMAADNCAVNSVVCNTPSGSAFPVGTTTDTCTATDQAGQTASCSFNVTVVDNQPPMISNMSVSPTTLSPPNHKIVDVAVNYTASDNCGAVTCALSGTSNEPDNGMGDGDTPNDIMPIDSHNIGLRAERSGRGNGRLYTITNTCTDAHANSTTATATVSVPKGK
jgi:hypothetical protein